MNSWVNKTHIGDCRELLARMADDGVLVQTCVTSPPYWGLRDYGTAVWEGGDRECDHLHKTGGTRASTLGEASGEHAMSDAAQERSIARSLVPYAGRCRCCGATRVDRQIGLEATPEDYVAELVDVFRLVRHLLADDGTVWLNLGDVYAANGTPGRSNLATFSKNLAGGGHKYDTVEKPRRVLPDGVKAKDLLGMPWRVAFALQQDGWYLRSDVIEEVELYCPCGCGHILEERIWRWSQDRDLIWHKPNPLPESVRDRPTRAHEYLFLLSKSATYFYNAEAIKERALFGVPNAPDRIKSPCGQGFARRARDVGVGANARPSKAVPNISASRKALRSARDSRHRSLISGGQSLQAQPNGMRNRRSVWTVATTPFSGAHFATFPRKLIEPCIAAGSRPGDVVLDPFLGSGTTRIVALDLGRQYIGCELSAAYAKLDQMRPTTTGLPF